MALENTVTMEDLTKWRFTHMEVNRIAIVVWAIVKHITISLEDEKDDSDKEMLCTQPQSLLKKISIKLEDSMFQYCNKRQSKTLLDYHKVIVRQLIDPQCVIFLFRQSLKGCQLPT